MSADAIIATGDGDVCEAAALQEEATEKAPILDSFTSVKALNWQKIKSATQFSERVGHVLITRTKSKTIYMLGGGNHHGDITEIWELDYAKPFEIEGLTWKPHAATSDFGGRYEFAACLNATEDKIWIFGGADLEQPRNDVCFLDLENNTFVTKFALNKEIALQTREGKDNEDYGVPFPRTQGGNSCLIYFEDKTYMAVYGGGVKGEHAVPDGHLYLFDIESGDWERIVVSGDTPGIRQGHAMTSVGTKGYSRIIGGEQNVTSLNMEINRKWENHEVFSKSSYKYPNLGRFENHEIFIHGGMHEFTIFDDLYSIDLAGIKSKAASWVKINTEIHPKGRAAQGLAKDGSKLYIFGGLGDEGAMGDLWMFNTESLEWSEIKTDKCPSPRLDAAITLINLGEVNNESEDPKKVILVHGGMNTEGALFSDFLALALK